MRNPRKYGAAPYRVAVIHGGPGAPGSMAPVARELAALGGILEPLQTEPSIAGQVRELHALMLEHGTPPLTLIGHSWGAWLSLILAALHPDSVGKLILVGSGPFEERYAAGIMATRLERLGEEERREVGSLLQILSDSAADGQDTALARFGELMDRTDTFAPLPASPEPEPLPFQGELYQRVWGEAAEMRRSRELLALAGRVACPVLAIHGDFDPHPTAGVAEPLASRIKDFRLLRLERCGHTPWFERHARERFFAILGRELMSGNGCEI